MNPDRATASPARPARRIRPPSPPLELVAVAALALDVGTVQTFLRSLPAVGDRMRRVEALRLLDQLQVDGLRVGEAERIVGLRFGVSPRQLRRWRTGL